MLFIIPARKLPELPIILAHSGGGLLVSEAIVAGLVCPTIYLELSTLMPHHVTEVRAHLPHSRLLIGSDLPESLETELTKILTLGLPTEAKREILWETPTRLFGTGG